MCLLKLFSNKHKPVRPNTPHATQKTINMINRILLFNIQTFKSPKKSIDCVLINIHKAVITR